jgi:hypothetical protein
MQINADFYRSGIFTPPRLAESAGVFFGTPAREFWGSGENSANMVK